MNRLSAIASASALLFAGGVVLASIGAEPKPHPQDDPVFTHEVVAYEALPAPEGEEPIVRYQYLSHPLPEKLAPDEVLEKRTSSSYTRKIKVENQGTPQEKTTYTAFVYSRETFYKKGNEWYYLEQATTTETAFNAAQAHNPIARFLLPEAHAASVSAFSFTGDGYVDKQVDSSSPACSIATPWSVAVSTTGGTLSAVSNTGDIWASSATSYTNNPPGEDDLCIAEIIRIFVPFDTSTIPSGSTITAATLDIFAKSKSDSDNDGNDFITVVQGSQATHTTLAGSDYNNVGTTEGIDSGERKDITSITTSAHLVFTLNSTGYGFIAKSGQTSVCSATTGITCLALREGHDFLNDRPADNTTDYLIAASADTAGTTQDPLLSVTYVAGSFAFWQFQDF